MSYRCKVCGQEFGKLHELGRHTLVAHPKGGEAPKEDVLLPDIEADFLQKLKDLAVKNPETVAKYVYTVADLDDLELVGRALKEADVNESKRNQILRVWSKNHGSSEVLERILSTSPGANAQALAKAQAKRYTIDERGLVVPNEYGEYTDFQEAYMSAKLLHQPQQPPQQQGSEESRLIREELKELREALVNQQISGVKEMITTVNQRVESLAQGQKADNQYGVLSKFLDKADSQMSGLRTDVKGGFEAMAAMQKPPRPPLTPEEKTRIVAAGKVAVGQQKRVQQLASEILNWDTPGFRPKPAVAPPVLLNQ